MKSLIVRFVCHSAMIFGTVVSTSGTPMLGQEKPAVSYPQGTEQITEGRVLGTISFLASDELAGRGTGTSEFQIAAAYVASRFRGAGLEPMGDNGTFFHDTTNTQRILPTDIELRTDSGELLTCLGILASSEEATDFRGSVTRVDLTQESWSEPIEGFVVGTLAPSGTGARALNQVSRTVQKIEAAGGKGLLLMVTEDSDWVEIAKQLVGKPKADSRNPLKIPVLLVANWKESITQIACKVAAPQKTQQVMRNVIGCLRGSDPELSKQAVLFSAHLDHLGTKNQSGDNIYNGADDDASGVTAVLTLADAFGNRGEKPKRSILFMTFWGEESGLLGSRAYAARPLWPLENTLANVNIEMIGRPEDGARGKMWVTGWNESNLGALMHASSSRWGIDIFEHPKFSAMLYRSSDNWSFVEKNVIAHSFSAGSLHPDYHQPDDEWDRLEIPHMTQVIRGLFTGSLPLVQGEVTPIKKPK